MEIFLFFLTNFNLQEEDYGLRWPTIIIICCLIVYVFGLFITAGFGVVSLLDSILSLALVDLVVKPVMNLPQVSPTTCKDLEIISCGMTAIVDLV